MHVARSLHSNRTVNELRAGYIVTLTESVRFTEFLTIYTFDMEGAQCRKLSILDGIRISAHMHTLTLQL